MNIEEMYKNYLKTLETYISFKSVSTDSKYDYDSLECVNWLDGALKDLGAKTHLVKLKKSNPILIAKWTVDPSLETIFVYGHYDVQPAVAKNWQSDPFKLRVGEKKIFARGVVDNKGQNLIHIIAISELYKNNLLKKNVVFLIEGNEESGSLELADFLDNNKEELACDKIIISDGQLVSGYPTLEVSLRGGGNIRVILRTYSSNKHSGLYGGAIPNAALELTKLVSKLKDSRHMIAIPGYYKQVDEITPEMFKNNKKLDDVSKGEDGLHGFRHLVTEPNIDFYTQVGLRPALEVSGIYSGYIGDGFSNIIPCSAECRINLRLVPSQDPKRVQKLITEFLTKNCPKYADLTFEYEDFNKAVVLEHPKEETDKIRELLEKSFNKNSFLKYCGGSIPVVEDMQRIFGLNPFLISLGNDDCHMHGIDENFDIDLIKSSLDFSYKYFSTS